MDESRIIIDWNEQGDGSYDIRVVGYRNFKQHFSEAFYSIERPMSVFSVSDSSISGEVACNSATITLLKHLLNIIGNGKTTWAKALQLLVSGLNLKNPTNNLYYVFPLCNAKDLAMRSKGNYSDWRNVMRYQLMIVDDLGTEPREVMEFGNVYTPLIDLISTRYEEQLYTIFTTNLTPAQLEERYGKRIVDRLNEMVEKVVFENESYRR